MNRWKQIFTKEFMDILRDKRSRNSAFLSPMIIIIVSLIAFGYLEQTLSQPSNQKILILKGTATVAATKQFEHILTSAKFKLGTVTSYNSLRAGIDSGSIKLAISIDQRSPKSPLVINEYFDPNSEAASIPKGMLDAIVAQANNLGVKEILKTHGLPPELAQPIKPIEHKITHGSASTSQELMTFLPYLIVVWAFYGGLGAVGELVAGEKEKNTLETLLLTPSSRTSVALGKLSALSTLGLSSSLSSLVGVVFVALLHLKATVGLFPHGVGISFPALLTTILVLIPTVLLFASLMLAISSLARNVREAYTRLTVVNIVVLTPAILSQVIGFTGFARSHFIALVPVLNSANTIREALGGTFDPIMIGGTVVVNGLLGALFLAYAVHLFNREDVLLRV